MFLRDGVWRLKTLVRRGHSGNRGMWQAGVSMKGLGWEVGSLPPVNQMCKRWGKLGGARATDQVKGQWGVKGPVRRGRELNGGGSHRPGRK